jgi:hypothetical protein
MSAALIMGRHAAERTALSMLLAWPTARLLHRDRLGNARRRRNACARRMFGYWLSRRIGSGRA